MKAVQLYSPAIVFLLFALLSVLGIEAPVLARATLAIAFIFHVKAELALYRQRKRR